MRIRAGKLVMTCGVVATLSASSAYADDLSDPQSAREPSKNAKRVLSVLSELDMDSAEMRNFVSNLDQHIKGDKYYTLAETQVAGGNLKLHFEMDGGLGIRQMELRYAPDDSNLYAAARTRTVMAGYHLSF